MCRTLIGIVMGLGLAVTVVHADITDGMVAHWPLDEGTGATAGDVSGNDIEGTLNGGPTWVEGRFGAALEFDGTDDHVDCGNPGILDFGTSDFTISAWVRTSGGSYRTVYGKGGDDGGGIRCHLAVDGSVGRIIVDDDADKKDPTGSILVGDQQWHLLVAKREGTNLRLYVDGVEDAGLTAHARSTLPAGYDLSGTSQYGAYIGCITTNNDGSLYKFFSGVIDDLALWTRALTVEEIAFLWNNGDGNPVPPIRDKRLAFRPDPVDEAEDVSRDPVLTWAPGISARTHDVYLSTNFDDVNDGIALVSSGQDANAYEAGRLEFSQTYFWRVDEVNAAPDLAVFEGDVWSFTTEPLAYVITDVNVTASIPVSGGAGGPEQTVDGSGLTDGRHSTVGTDMWLGDAVAGEPVWIRYDFGRPYKLYDVRIWNHNSIFEELVGLGAKSVTVEYAADADDWTVLGDFEIPRAPASDDYAGMTIELGGIAAQFVRININSNWGGRTQYGLAEVRFSCIPVAAREPRPASDANDVALAAVLSWRAGREADTHQVHFSTDSGAVAGGTALIDTVGASTYSLTDLNLGTTYYWKIDEVNDAATPSMWAGPVWSFTTTEYLVVEDFESYTGDQGQEIFSTWIDGYNVPDNGSQVGHDASPFVEQTEAYSGGQSMPLYYGRDSASHSEVNRTFDPPQNWARAGIKTLTLYVRGRADNVAGQFTVKVNGVAKAVDVDFTAESWQEVNVELASLGVDLQRVTSLAISIESTGSGLLYIDDMQLSALEP